MGQYQELRRLTPLGVRSKSLAELDRYLAATHGIGVEPSRGVDLDLLDEAQNSADPLPLLALRCRLSHALEAWLRATEKAHRNFHGIELQVMASYALDDEGKLTIRTAAN